ncbi:12330_t:CDS:10 [Dentiscutata erythropus]|uniref:12330_t:CDS:1 n=1 Tax=Dentiscutata erythropus TaxID=1348616 RepID=A0A9N8ZVE3_9GLOM|nr:12330_t:CDS:10 [Dentiscutata erythropus]
MSTNSERYIKKRKENSELDIKRNGNSERDIKRRKGNNKNKTNNRSNKCYNCGVAGHFARDCTSDGSRKPQETILKLRPSPHEIEKDQLKTLSDNFNSAELSYGGSDKVVFTPLGDEFKYAWKRFMKKELVHQHKMRHFITSCLAAIDKQQNDEVEELVTELGQPEGLERIREIVMFPMSVDAGLSGSIASFQRVILPFMALLTRTRITECIVEKYVNAIFYIIYSNLDSFMYDGVIDKLDILVKRNDIVDKKINQSKLIEDDATAFIPTSLCNVFMKRIKETSTNETMYKIVEKIEQTKKLWQNTLQQDIGSTYNEPLASNVVRREYFFTILDKEIDNMKKVLNYHRRNLLSQKTKPNKPNKHEKLAKKVALMLDYDPPGELSKNGPRHDNDFSEISKISIIPTKNEILCDRYPFLPTTNMDDALHHLPKGAERLLDTQFRLLREDMMCPIRLGIENFIKFISESAKNHAKIKRLQEHGGRHKYEDKEGMEGGDLNVYANVHFSDIKFNQRQGFSCQMSFTQPPMRRHSGSKQDRLQYWKKSGKLMNGSLVCLLWPSGNNSPNSGLQFSLFFGTVSFRDENLLSQDQQIALIDISFIDSRTYQIALEEIKRKNFSKQTAGCFMVESTGVYFESYYHILKALQTTLPSNIPFEKYLAPQITETSSFAVVDPPIYTRAPEFVFDLSVLLKDKNKRLLLNVADTSSHEIVIQNLQKLSTLDDTQAKSLVYSLCREVALIEGPPGTGKTFVGVEIMKVLLANKNTTKIGPILAICFTNHALDQFLENLLNAGVEKIVRLGGRSKSETIKRFNIEELCQKRDRSRGQKSMLHEGYGELGRIENEAEKIRDSFSRRWLNWDNIASYLFEEYPDHLKKFQNPDIPNILLDNKNELQIVDKDKNRKDKQAIFDQWINGSDLDLAQKWVKNFQIQETKSNMKANEANVNSFKVLGHINNEYSTEYMEDIEYSKIERNMEANEANINTPETLENIEDSKDSKEFIRNWLLSWVEPEGNRPLEDIKYDPNVWQMSKGERIRLHDFWKENVQSDYLEDLVKIKGQYEEKKNAIDKIYDENRRQFLRDCDVIGMTTNGAAKFQTLIRSIGPRIIICEEAGEVLEAHILSSLTPETQHMILIGDHNQLRPHCATYSLTCDSKIGCNYALDKSLFERLVNGDQAMRLKKSKLCTQRRMRGEISDLIRYTLYKELVDDENTVKYPDVCGAQRNVYFMDHHHPEDSSENDFALNSHSNTFEVKMVIGLVKHFVRNGYNKPGQIAVLTPYLGQLIKIRDMLSNSYVVVIDERDDQLITSMEESIDGGNKNSDSGSVSSIENINSVAEKKKLSQQVVLRTVDNFQGEEADIVIISLVRNTRKESDHGNIGFLKSTNRSNVLLSRAKHGMFLLGNADLMVRHSDFWKKVLEILRKRGQVGPGFPIVCSRHPECKSNIYDASEFDKISPEGGRRLLKCGHTCPYRCHLDDTRHIGVFCQKACIRLYPDCQHPCRNKMCGEDCGDCLFPIGSITLPCRHKYENAKCHHNKNIDKVLCNEKVLRKLPNCEHEHLMKGTCNLPCGVPCNRLPCNLRCEKLLNCGHQCFGICGEKCPPSQYCAECTTDDNVKNQVVDLIMQETFAEVDWTSERMIVLDCGHVYTADSLDHLMEMNEYYEKDDKNDKWIQIKTITSQPSDPKSCPQCRTPIKNIYRYGRATKKNGLDVQTKKFLVKYDNQLKKLNKDITSATKLLENKRKELLKEIQKPLKDKETKIIEKDSVLQKLPEIISTEQYIFLEKYSIPLMYKERWKQHISVLLAIYQKLMQIMLATKSPPHKLAYEAAVSLLYEHKARINICDFGKNFMSLDNSNYDSPVHQHIKLQETLADVGLSAPKVDVKIYLDAFLEIVNIQKVIFHELTKIAETQKQTSYEKNWVKFSEDIIGTIKKHLDIIITTAKQNSYLRHDILSSLELAEVECKTERFRLKYTPTGQVTPIIRRSVKNKCSEIERTCENIWNKKLPIMSAENFEEQCKLRINKIRREVSDLRDAAMKDRPLTREEKLEISRAMNSEFQGSGHWYQCPNGHPYTIGECGGAMQASR